MSTISCIHSFRRVLRFVTESLEFLSHEERNSIASNFVHGLAFFHKI